MKGKEVKKIWWQPGVTLALQISGWIVGPIILAIFIGKWLDDKYNTKPWLFLACVGTAFIISNIGIVRETLKTMKKIEKEKKSEKNLDKKENK